MMKVARVTLMTSQVKQQVIRMSRLKKKKKMMMMMMKKKKKEETTSM